MNNIIIDPAPIPGRGLFKLVKTIIVKLTGGKSSFGGK